MVKEDVVITNRKGIHARPASLLARTCLQFESEVSIVCRDMTVSAKDVLGILSLQAVCGTSITVIVEGPDEKEALAEVVELICTGFDFD